MITSLGIGSGLDLESLVGQLVAASAQGPAARLNQREAQLQADISGLGLLSSTLASLRGALTPLQSSAAFSKATADSSNTDLVTANATGDASAASYEIEVTALAQAHKLVSSGYADADAAIGQGTLTFVAGETAFSVTIDATNDSLTGLRDAINQAADGEGVSASLLNVDDGAGGTVTKLLLTGRETGTTNAISVVADDADGNDTDAAGLSVFAFQAAGTQNLTEVQAAADAQLVIDGQAVTRPGNSISDVVTGLTLNLVEAEPGTPVTVSVAVDTAAAKQLVSDFVAAYNEFVETLAALSAFDQQSGEAGLLLGDATLRGVQRQLRDTLLAEGFDTELTSLASIGVGSAADGKLAIDDTRLDAALASSLDRFGDFFSAEQGLATRLAAIADDYTAAGGSIEQRTDSLERTIDRIDDRRATVNRRALALEERLRAQFLAMDALVANLTTTSEFLAEQLAKLPNNVLLTDR